MLNRSNKKPQETPTPINNKRPSLPVAGTSNNTGVIGPNETDVKETTREPWRKRCCRYVYNRETKEFCGRTCKNWLYIIVYSIMYLIFLSTYTLILLYGSLAIIKFIDDYQTIDKTELFTYSKQGIGISATPTSSNNMPVIWYRNDPKDYQKYIDDLQKLFSKRSKRETKNFTEYGPCGAAPFGYGKNPCVVIRINKQLKWSAKPLNETAVKTLNVPNTVQNWMKLNNQKLWLYCDGYHSYDREHIGNIKYYPDPPGFDPELFPLDKNSYSPLIAVQFSKFTLGVSLAVQCKLWYEHGVSTIEFMLYVTPKRK